MEYRSRMKKLLRAVLLLATAMGAASIVSRLRRAPRPPLPPPDLSQPGARPRVVVVGAGFGGLYAAALPGRGRARRLQQHHIPAAFNRLSKRHALCTRGGPGCRRGRQTAAHK